MVNSLKARAYAYMHSRNFKVLLWATGIWFIGTLISVTAGVRPEDCQMSTIYALWTYLEFYFCLIPAIVPSLYFNTRNNGFEKNIPFQMTSPSFSGSALLFSFIMNLICTVFYMICAAVIYSLPNKYLVLHNEPIVVVKMVLVLLLLATGRWALLVFLTELTESRVWSGVLGILSVAGEICVPILAVELMFCNMFGIKESILPVASMTSYFSFNGILPVPDMEAFDYRATDLVGNLPLKVIGIIIYIAIYTGMTIAIKRRKDVA